MKKSNLLNDKNGKSIIHHLKVYGNTCIRYQYIERYTKKRILSALEDAGLPNCRIRVITENFEPDTLFSYICEDTNRIEVTDPILPAVIVEWMDHPYMKDIPHE